MWLYSPFFLFFILPTISFIFLIIIFKTNNNLVASAAGAFFGTAAALFLNISYSYKKMKLKNCSSLRKAEYLIDKILRNSNEIKKDLDRYSEIQNGVVYEWEKVRRYDNFFSIPEIKIQELMFLVDQEELGKETLNSILCVNAQNLSLIHFLEERNYKYGSYLDSTEKVSYSTQEDLEKIIGKKLCIELEGLTNKLRTINDSLIENCGKAISKINNFLTSYQI